MKKVRPIHHQPITVHMETGQIGEIGEAFYAFLRGVLRASSQIDQRRATRQQLAEDTDTLAQQHAPEQ